MFSCDSVVDSCFSCDPVVTVFYPILVFVDPEPKTSETIESVCQLEQFFSVLPNYAENQRVQSEMSMLGEIAAEAAALAEAQTQPGDLHNAVDSVEAARAKMAGHCVKRLAVAAGEDGRRKGDRSRSMTVKT